MPQFAVLVYLPAPADPATLSPDYLHSLADYPERVKGFKATVLGGSYFAAQRGFAFDARETGVTVLAHTVRSGTLSDSHLTPAAFFVLSAPDLEVAVQAARLHPAVKDGALEVRPLLPPPAR